MKAKYKYEHRLPDGTLESHECDVEIIFESVKQYQIKLLAPNVRGHKWGDVIWVRKSSVVTSSPQTDCTNEWWQNL